MARIPIIIAPDPILNLKSHPVKPAEITDQMRNFIKDMTDAMYSDQAVGFAAIQFGVPKNIIVIDLQNDEEEERPKGFYPLTIINPELLSKSEEMIVAREGCMSIPEIRLDVPRPKEVEIKFVDIDFKEHTLKADGWLARVIQHEMDHLEGKTLLDHMSSLKKNVSIRKLEKFKNEHCRMKVIFMGTPDFAVPALSALIESSHIISAVFTQAPKPRDRGMEEKLSPVHSLAKKHDLPVYHPKTLRSEEVLTLINNIEADIIIVVAYGFIIPKAILEAKKYGCLNIHPSALPRFRGAAPLQRTIIAGDKETEICIMQMDEGLDTGDIILRQKFVLHPRVTLQELHNNCANIGAQLLIKTLENIDTLQRIKQTEEGLIYAHKLIKEEGIINWNDSAFNIDCKVRGMNPWPGVFFKYEDDMIKVLETEYIDINHQFVPGTVLDDELNIACGIGILTITKLQRAGKTPLSSKDFLRGYTIKKNHILLGV